MDEQLKDLNKLLQKSLNRKSPKNYEQIFKIIIILVLLVIIPFILISVIPPLNKLLSREMIIVGQNPIVNFGQQVNLASPLGPGSKNRINLLFLGIPGKGYHGEKLTDTIIIINTTPKGEKPIGISIPRDLLVKFPDKDYYAKINSLFDSGRDEKQGIELITVKLKEITNLDIDYFVVFDLDGVKNLIDQLDGIDVVVRENIYDPKFPAPYDSYEVFSINRGVYRLNGETTLKYIRSRNQINGDFARIKRQQEVINILKNRILSLNFIWDFPTILNIWKTINSHTYTNIGLNDIKYAWNLAKKTNLDEIKFSSIDTENQLLVSDEMMLDNEKAYVLKPKAGKENYEEIKEYINQLINNL